MRNIILTFSKDLCDHSVFRYYRFVRDTENDTETTRKRRMGTQDLFDFEGDDYAGGDEYRPFAQMVNPKINNRLRQLGAFGIAVTAKQAVKNGFSPTEEQGWIMTEHKFSTEEELIIVTTRPRIVIIRRSPIGIKSRETGKVMPEKTMEDYLADKLKYKTFTKYLVLFIDQNCVPLHDPNKPFAMTLNGAAGASFGQNYFKSGQNPSGFRFDLETAYAQHRDSKAERSPMNDLFHAHGVFCPHIESEEKGVGSNTALVSTTVGYDKPTPRNISKFLINPKSELGQVIKEIYTSNPDFGVIKPKESPVYFANSEPRDFRSLEAEVMPDVDDYEYGEPPY